MLRTDRPDPRRLAHCEPQPGKTLLWRILTPLLPGPRKIARARAPRMADPANLAARKNVRTGGVQRRKISAWSPRHLAQCIVKELPPPRLVPRQSRRRHQLQQRPWDQRRRGGQLRKRRPQRGGRNVAREPVREGVLFSRVMSRPPCEPEVRRKELKRTQERHKRRVPA